MINQILRQPPHDLYLLLTTQPLNRDLNHAAHARIMHRHEALIIHEGEHAHDELAVHAIRDASVARDGLAEVLDLESALEARGEEAAEGRDQRGKSREDEDVELDGLDGDGAGRGEWGPGGESVSAGQEDGVGRATEAGEDVCAEVLLGDRVSG